MTDADGWMPLTLAQLDFWEEFTFHPDEPVSTVAHYVTITGAVDADALARAIAQTAEEADVLALRFRETPEGVRQRVEPDRAPQLLTLDLRDDPAPEARAMKLMEQDFTATLDLRRDPLSAQWLMRTGDDRWIWYNRGHHSVLDGYSMLLLEQRCAQIYRHLVGAGPEGAPFLPFPRFIEEDRAYPATPAFAKDRAYWAAQLSGDVSLPVLQKGGEDYTAEGFEAECPLPEGFVPRLMQRAGDLAIGWPDLLVLITGAYLSQRLPYAGSALPVWLPYMSRMGSVSAAIPSLTVNILPLLVTPKADETFASYLTRGASDLKRLRRHGRYRVEQLAADRGIGAGSRFFFSPLVNVLPFGPPEFEGCEAEREVLSNGPADGFNVTFRSGSDGSGMTLFLEADRTTADTASFKAHCRDLPAYLAMALHPDSAGMTLHALSASLTEPA